MISKYIYQIENLNFSYGKKKVISDICLKIPLSKLYFITGPNGSGKTTFLKLLAGILKPSQGSISGPSILDKKSQCISFIEQNPRFVERWTCLENLKLVYDYNIYDNYENFKQEIDKLLHFFEFEGIHRKVSELSSGEKQKLSIVRSIINMPDTILADEPNNFLDHVALEKLYNLFMHLNNERGVTVIWASHNKEIFEKFNGKVVHLYKGRIIDINRNLGVNV